MKLSELIKGLEQAEMITESEVDPDIASLHFTAQDVRPGGAFVAIPGYRVDGHEFADMAVKNGASALFVERPVNTKAACIRVGNSRKALSALSAQFYGNPSKKMRVVGVTGTNGKTTITYLLEAIFKRAGLPVGVIGTVNCRWADKIFDNPRTTPESLDLMRILSQMHEDGVTHVIMEVASHAIDLHRVDHIRFDVGVFTNLSQDHLDHHGDMESYFSTKKQLFSRLLPAGPKQKTARAVIHWDDPWGKRLADELSSENGPAQIRVGVKSGSHVRAEYFRADLNGIFGKLNFQGNPIDFQSNLAGRFNLENILCAAGASIALGIPPEAVVSGIRDVKVVPGRLEKVENDREIFVVVDYSHTPHALENALQVLADMTRGRLICVFGCGGDRDRDKRPKMGRISAQFSHLSVVTSDNPRSENPDAIIREILVGMEDSGAMILPFANSFNWSGEKAIVIQPDRRCAIGLALAVARKGDTILIAGKGHEAYQEVNGRLLPFDDRVEAKKALEQLNGCNPGNHSQKTGEPCP